MVRVFYIGSGVFDIESLARRLDFVNEQVYVDSKFFDKFCYYYKRNGERRVFILLGGETISPDMNLFDYAFVYNRKMNYGYGTG